MGRNTVTLHPEVSGFCLVSTIPVDSEGIWTWDRWKIKSNLVRFPTIKITSKSDSGCNLGVRFSADWSWSPNLSRTRHVLGLHLELADKTGLLLLQALLQVFPGPLYDS